MTDARKQGILKAYASAVDFIAALAKADAASEILLYLSYYHLRMLINAGCVVLKVLNSSYAQELPSFESGRMAFNQATLALSRSSVFNNDPGAKVVQHMSQVWHHGLSSKRHAPPELIVKSRFGARLVDKTMVLIFLPASADNRLASPTILYGLGDNCSAAFRRHIQILVSLHKHYVPHKPMLTYLKRKQQRSKWRNRLLLHPLASFRILRSLTWTFWTSLIGLQVLRGALRCFRHGIMGPYTGVDMSCFTHIKYATQIYPWY